MESLASVRTQDLRIPILNRSSCMINSLKVPAFNNAANLNLWGNFHRIEAQRLARCSSGSGYGEEGSIAQQGMEGLPLSVDLELISSDSDFDRIVSEAQQLQESIVVLWMASWCRKCIYLKPKLAKLAACYYPRIRFYSIDVNTVPHKLVVRAGVTKMPTIQLWMDGKMQSEVIGGHKAYLVINEIREMIENENSSL